MRYQQRFSASDPVDAMGGATPFAEGGETSHVGPYRIHMFKVDQANTYSIYKNRENGGQGYNYVTNFVVTQGGAMDVLIVAGGGGGAGMGGGGGAGGYLYYPNLTVGAGTTSVQVGGGGNNEFAHNDNTQSKGGDSIFGSLTATGGGKGISYSSTAPSTPTSTGGSGGGGPAYGGYNNGNGFQIPAGSGTPGQGHPGGKGHHAPHGHAGGGGGGAGQAGFDYDNPNHSIRNNYVPNGTGNRTNLYPPASPYAAFPTTQKGGNGLANDISGYPTHYAGGGGGGGHPGHAINRSAGGLGGGGEGVSYHNHNNAPLASDTLHQSGQPGQLNTGGGGGGSTHHSTPQSVSGKGGPGIVIVRYRAR